jgi:hypothetical protein
MALNTQKSNVAVNAEADALAVLANTGYLRLYDGTQAATADTAIGAQVLLAELRFNATAFGAAVAGVITANAITADASANAAGTASWFRALKSDGTTVLFDGTAGTATSNMILNTTTISVGLVVSCSSLTMTVAKATAGS